MLFNSREVLYTYFCSKSLGASGTHQNFENLGTAGYRVTARKNIFGTDGYRVPARKKLWVPMGSSNVVKISRGGAREKIIPYQLRL